MIDSHCHLDHDPLDKKIPEILENAKDVGIEKILTISTTLNSFEKILKIIELDTSSPYFGFSPIGNLH